MKHLNRSVTIAAALLLAACTSAPAPAPEATQLASASTPESTEPGVLTGSRIPRKSTDRTVKAVGNQDYRTDNQIKSLGNEIGRPTQ